MYILRQTTCMIINPIMVDNFASLLNNTQRRVGLLTNWRFPPQSVSEGLCLAIHIYG